MLSYQVHPARASAAPYLLLVHGALSNNAQWALNLDALSRFCTPVTAELLGHGESPAPEDSSQYEPEAYLSHFEHIREQIGATQWFVAGYSLGASLTMRYALTHPSRVLGHLLTNSNSAFAESSQMQAWAEAGEKTLTQSAVEGRRYFEKLPVHPRFATRLPRAVYGPMVERAKLLDPFGAAQTLAVTAPRASVREQVGDNTRPALLLHGIYEKAFSAHAQFAHNAMPNLKIVELAAGHAVNMQAAEEFNQHVEEFVAAWAT